jgi:hypothetical protein
MQLGYEGEERRYKRGVKQSRMTKNRMGLGVGVGKNKSFIALLRAALLSCCQVAAKYYLLPLALVFLAGQE